MSALVNSEALRSVATGVSQFAPSFYQALAENEKKNIICSPISVSMVLSMLTFGAGSRTKEELQSVLHLSTDSNITKIGYQSLGDSLNNFKKVKLNLANKVYVANGFQVKPEFQQITETAFRSSAQNVDFKQAELASKTINTWCEEHTNNRIKDIIKKDDLDDSTAMILVNAVYFKGNWKNAFDKKQSSNDTFNIDEKTKKEVPMMFRHGKYMTGELKDLNSSYLELPYQSTDESDALSMFIILPREINGLKLAENNLHKVDFAKLEGYSMTMDVRLPKFKFTSDLDLTDVMQKMGIKDAFNDKADFSGISNNPLKISKIVQKAFIEVNEEGTEAAAATGVQMMLMSLSPSFYVDRPFLCAIVAKNTSTPLFTARILDPSL